MLLATYIKCISAQSAKRTVDLGQVMESLLQSSLKRAPLQARNRTFGSPHTICIQNLFTHQGCMLQARNSGFLLAANRLREVRLAASSGLQDTSNSEKAVASSEKAAGSIDSPAGIPPQGSKPAGTKPDPKAKPFTPGI